MQETSKDREMAISGPSENGIPSTSTSVTSFSQMVPGSQEGGTGAVQLLPRGLMDSPQNNLIPTTDSSHSLQQATDIFVSKNVYLCLFSITDYFKICVRIKKRVILLQKKLFLKRVNGKIFSIEWFSI